MGLEGIMTAIACQDAGNVADVDIDSHHCYVHRALNDISATPSALAHRAAY